MQTALRPSAADATGVAQFDLSRPAVMGVLNVTPDSFSDGGLAEAPEAAASKAAQLIADGATVLDIGGESTRPGATPTPPEIERARVLPVLERLAEQSVPALISIDTRNADTALAALDRGARLFNDVSALRHDPASAEAAAAYAEAGGGVCLMHAQGDPQTMQHAPRYDDVVDDVAAFLEARLAAAVRAGAPERSVWLDPGVGFGKTYRHNVALLQGLERIVALGRPVLVGVSRKGFIGWLTGVDAPSDRAPGSVAAGLYALSKGARILRVHDVAETTQAVAVWTALAEPEKNEVEQ